MSTGWRCFIVQRVNKALQRLRIELALYLNAVTGLALCKYGFGELLENSVTSAAATGLLEVGSLLKLALLTGVEGFHRAVVAHHAGVHGALGALGLVFSENLLIGLYNRLYFSFHGGVNVWLVVN